jgi:hypothetical protein
MKAFLLRFEEPVVIPNRPRLARSVREKSRISILQSGTQTVTEVERENGDTDPRKGSYLALPTS